MARRTLAFTQGDVIRAVKGAKSAGMEVARVEIGKDGTIVLLTSGGDKAPQPESAFDAWKAKNNARPS